MLRKGALFEMGFFITFEGQEGAGKTTQAQLLYEFLQETEGEEGREILLTREPGGTELTEAIRGIIMDKKHHNMSTITEVLLFLAARAQLVSEIIRPILSKGGIVICDRYIDSTIAYQAFGNELGMDFILELCKFATDNLMPDITFLLEIDPKIGLARKDSALLDRIEERGDDFHLRVKKGYDRVAKDYSERVQIIDSAQPMETIHKYIREKIQEGIL